MAARRERTIAIAPYILGNNRQTPPNINLSIETNRSLIGLARRTTLICWLSTRDKRGNGRLDSGCHPPRGCFPPIANSYPDLRIGCPGKRPIISDVLVLAVVTVCVIPANCAWLRPDLTIDRFWRKAAIKHRPIGAQTLAVRKSMQRERDRMSIERSINFGRKTETG
jgi:hypothetical protein